MDGQKLWSHTVDHVIHLKCSPMWWESTMSIILQACPITHNPIGLAEKYVQLVKNLFYKAKEEGKDLVKCLMVYHNTPLSNILCSPMQILASRSARSNLSISNTARKQLGLDCQDLRSKYKNEHSPLHDLHLNQVVMYQDPTTKRWFPVTISKLCQEPRIYIITTKEGVQYRKTQAHLKPHHLQDKIVNSELVSQNNHMWTVKTLNSKQSTTNLPQSRPKRDIRPPIKLDL